MNQKFRFCLLLLTSFIFITILTTIEQASALSPLHPKWQLVLSPYQTTDTFVAGYNVRDYGAKGDGKTDVTSTFQTLLDSLGDLGGGTLYVPEGKYVLRGNLIIPKGVTMRGIWKQPVRGQKIVGTILMAYSGRGDEDGQPFITMETSSAVRDLAIWYPQQLPNSIVAYPPTILFGKPGSWGNEFCNARNITLVNSYNGLIFSQVTGGSSPVINGLYGTPLSKGIEIDNIADVGRIEWVDFSPDYWMGSGLPNAPTMGGTFRPWLKDHGTGIVMKRNDWSYTCFVSIDGYNTGYLSVPSTASPGAIPNGHHYDMNFSNCFTAMDFKAISGDGMLFARIKVTDCQSGIRVGAGTSGILQLYASQVAAKSDALTIDKASSTRVLMSHCTVSNGRVTAAGGTLLTTYSHFSDNASQITLGPTATGLISGNKIESREGVINNSYYDNVIDNGEVVSTRPLPLFPEFKPESHRPKRSTLYVVTAAPYKAVGNGIVDDTKAIQAALNKASSEGGGVVFLPPGRYKVVGNLNVPQGVELKGSVDTGTLPTGPASVIQVYAGRNKPTDLPFLKLSGGAGLQGVVFDYPEQQASKLPNIAPYPYTIQVTGSNAYIVNVGVRAAYNAIDLFSYKCDNHYVDFVTGHAFKTGVKVGGGSTGGKILNMHFNPSCYASGAESKWGSWANSPDPSDISPVYDYAWDNLDFMVLGDCQNELLYNDFHYGSKRGLVLVKEGRSGPTGISLGLGIDAARKSINIEAIGKGSFDFINTQLVSLGGGSSTAYVQTDNNFDGQSTFYNTDLWGNPGHSVVVNNGSLRFTLANFHNSGAIGFALVDQGHLTLDSSVVWPSRVLLNSGAEQKLSVDSCIIDPTKIDLKACTMWTNNLGISPSAPASGAIDRQGWTATASAYRTNGKYGLDSRASTRWDTASAQKSGQWYEVDMKGNKTFNRIVLDNSASPTDSPVGYEVYVSDDGNQWGQPIASGAGTVGLTLIGFATQNARYIRVVQTGTGGNFWSIHEFNVYQP